MNDEGIRKNVEKIILKKKFENVAVRVENKVVYLNGKVNSYDAFLDLGLLIGEKKNVEGVVNNLKYPNKKRKEKKKGSASKIGKADVVIVGGGVIGASIARELSKYKLRVILVEKASDVACGATKANNAMVHTGIGENMGTLKQKLCVKGQQMFEKISDELNVPYKQNGMWIITTKDSMAKMKLPSFISDFIAKRIIPMIVLRRGKKLGITMNLTKRRELLKREPNITKKVLVGIYSPTYGITCPYLFTIALVENAMENGVEVMLNTEVVDIVTKEGKVESVVTTKGIIDANFVINAAGLYTDEIADMAGAREYTIHPKKGATLIFDKKANEYINHSMSMLRFPRMEHYKGGGAMTTIDGNIQWGPTISETPDKEDTTVTTEDIEKMFESYSPLLEDFPEKSVITYFSGLRACTFTEDFIIKSSKKIKGFIHAAGIQSPGLTAAPAIAEMTISILKNEGLKLEAKNNFNPYNKKKIVIRDSSSEEKKKLIEKNPQYGEIVCRCEQVTKGEVVDAIYSKIPALSIDAIKRRTRAGMGRCQGGFCLPNIVKILAQETDIPIEDILKNEEGSDLFIGRAKCLLEDKYDEN